MRPPHIKTRLFSICIPHENSDDLVFCAEFSQVDERGARGEYGEPLEPDHKYIAEIHLHYLRDERGIIHDYPHSYETALQTIENNEALWEERHFLNSHSATVEGRK